MTIAVQFRDKYNTPDITSSSNILASSSKLLDVASNMSTMPPTHCTGCGDEFQALEARIPMAGDDICRECFDCSIKPQFESALVNEADYPPTIGRTILNILDYSHLLPGELIDAYIKKGNEYAILPKHRVYCSNNAKCSAFLGHISKEEFLVLCEECHSTTCMSCCKIVRYIRIRALLSRPHKCKKLGDPNDHQLPEETRGKEWQVCPGEGCGILVTLKDGCNHVICTVSACRTEFCFFCGKPAKGSSGHWRNRGPTSCPRYGTTHLPEAEAPGAMDAIIEQAQEMRLRLDALVEFMDQPDILQPPRNIDQWLGRPLGAPIADEQGDLGRVMAERQRQLRERAAWEWDRMGALGHLEVGEQALWNFLQDVDLPDFGMD
ncbi:uncharacterized protein RCC_08781 [Ramularia collo-cygni]|uniref:RBR-type E3 ubiquitin transferase n=1 Tax=Ramularia collo-cygni TaxID=112498 RepID=A0A2D3VG09_9PEZI|nr:uncharacterized protein RCC_08781 [Ramularia collo-cygni]CZT23071.1 uncharacterized protein RCC_08781 [Ramularia collo-cygni]